MPNMITAQLNVTRWLFDTLSKYVNQTWCFEATELKFYGNDVETLHQRIEFLQRLYSVANNAGKVDRHKL